MRIIKTRFFLKYYLFIKYEFMKKFFFDLLYNSFIIFFEANRHFLRKIDI